MCKKGLARIGVSPFLLLYIDEISKIKEMYALDKLEDAKKGSTIDLYFKDKLLKEDSTIILNGVTPDNNVIEVREKSGFKFCPCCSIY